MKTVRWCVLLFCLTAALLNAQAPAIQNADIQTRPSGANLKATIDSLAKQSTGPAWIAYGVPMVAGKQSLCCYYGNGDNGCCTGCDLERNRGGIQGSSRSQAVQLEGSRTLLVLLRAEGGRLDKVRVFSSECPLDAGGLRVYWLSGAEASQSVDYLSGLIRNSDWGQGREKHIANGALAALAHHAGAPADTALAGFLSPDQARGLRKQAAFWLCSARGAAGFETVRKTVRSDNDEQFRKQAMFALSVSDQDQAVDELIHFARNDSSVPVRRQALFWLAQKAGKKATATLTAAIEQDPDTQVKKHAVFALSQLPKDEGIPLLIGVARNNTNHAVRKQAMFWLGQSNDPRALEFFEEVLAK